MSDDASSDVEGESTSLSSFFARTNCLVCFTWRVSQDMYAFSECGHMMCVPCVGKARGPTKLSHINCPLCRQERDCSTIRKVKFEVVAHDDPNVLAAKRAQLSQIEEENRQLETERQAQLDRVEESTAAHATLTNELSILEDHHQRVVKALNSATR